MAHLFSRHTLSRYHFLEYFKDIDTRLELHCPVRRLAIGTT
jgi:hypothetical protein